MVETGNTTLDNIRIGLNTESLEQYELGRSLRNYSDAPITQKQENQSNTPGKSAITALELIEQLSDKHKDDER